MQRIEESEFHISSLGAMGPQPSKPPVESASETIPKPGSSIKPEDKVKALKTPALPGEAKAAEPRGLPEMREAMYEIALRWIEEGVIAVEGMHNPAVLISESFGLMLSALGIGRIFEDPTVKGLGEVTNLLSVAATVTGGVLAGTILGASGAAYELGHETFHLTTLALEASSSTRVGAFLGGGMGEYLEGVTETQRPSPTRMQERAASIMERGGSGWGY